MVSEECASSLVDSSPAAPATLSHPKAFLELTANAESAKVFLHVLYLNPTSATFLSQLYREIYLLRVQPVISSSRVFTSGSRQRS